MARFDFQSPGAAFTNQIAETLTRRKAEERQRMLDQLTVNADMRAQESATRQEEAHRAQLDAMAQSKLMGEQQLAANKQGMELSRVGALEGMLDAGDDPTGRMSQEDVELLQKWGKLAERQAPIDPFRAPEGSTMEAVDADMEAQRNAPPTLSYVGTQQQRERQRLRDQSAKFIEMLQSNPEQADLARAAEQSAQMNDGIVPGDFMAQFIMPRQEVVIFDEPSGRFLGLDGKPISGRLPRDAKVVERSHPPRLPQQRQPMFIGNDENGNPVYWDPFTNEKVSHQGITRPGAGNSQLGALGIPASIIDEIQIAGAAVGSDPQAASDSDLENYRTLMTTAFMNSKVKSNIAKQLAVRGIHDASAAAMEIERLRANGQFNEADMKDFITLMSVVPDHTKTVLNAHPFDPNKKKSSWRDWVPGF